jgi:hypothetical protein
MHDCTIARYRSLRAAAASRPENASERNGELFFLTGVKRLN